MDVAVEFDLATAAKETISFTHAHMCVSMFDIIDFWCIERVTTICARREGTFENDKRSLFALSYRCGNELFLYLFPLISICFSLFLLAAASLVARVSMYACSS